VSSSLRIVVAGLVARHPLGGPAWDYLQYVLGLARLGHDVVYHEDTWCWPFDPVANTMTDDSSYPAGFLARFFDEHAPDLAERWHYRHLHETSHGMSFESFERFAAGADLFLNVSGATFLPEALPDRAVTVFVDTDPGYNQIVLANRPGWSENVDRWAELVRSHDRHVTYGERIGAGATIPTVGIDWRPTRMPVVVDLWDGGSWRGREGRWSTVMTWSAFPGPLEHDGVGYHDKGHNFEAIADLPGRLGHRPRLALGGIGAPTERLAALGWDVVDGPTATLDPAAYRRFIWDSRGELSCAKHVYSATGSGWFSCRSACYLAAGRPVVVQRTGAPVPGDGFGLRYFDDAESAVDAVAEIDADLDAHRTGARQLARDWFGHDRVLPALLDGVMR